MKALPTAHDVVRFWQEAGPSRWFDKNDAFDAEFKSRFEDAHHAAATGALDAWAADAEGALALIVLLDQFPRNAWRGSGHMFATDGKALAIARAAIDAGHDRRVDPPLRPFFYLPFMHSESLAEQERSVALNAELDANTQRFAVLHRDLIARFGRFPHRNRMLGRSTTPEEQAYLDGGGFAG
ncbi:DUF924 family protein [Variovorax sp. YR216]|uniref:DUF924 family protein n=1 Tax=Variovorax sp. YR216 TaxID=1882828 RepID=UPI00089575E9|nr:DUF924 family protein [Variovorax sp. YR216]SEA56840.1 Uncharacterized conserved protein, DUF924 family [Variovorax sp. YR216]